MDTLRKLKVDIEKRKAKKFEENARLSGDLNAKNANTNLYDFINTSSTRVGAILILVFMVQFLSRIHRYNAKLSDFYASRANALSLSLSGSSDFTLQNLTDILSPDGIDIRQTKLPTAQVMDFIKTTLQTTIKK